MFAEFNISDLIKATSANLIRCCINDHINFSISTDTRSIQEGQLYIPLIGDNFNGHDYINRAIELGAAGCLINKDFDHSKIINTDIFLLQVNDTLESLLQLASYHRCRNKSKIIAITGSSGKTTTKELLYSIFHQVYKTQKSEKNFNNEIGLSKTLLSIKPETDFTIVEMGMRGLGEIDILAKYAKPNLALITNVGSAHIGRLGSIENIAIAKTEILNYLDPTLDACIIYGEDSLLEQKAISKFSGNILKSGAKQNIQIIDQNENLTVFNYKNEEYIVNLPGYYNVLNATSAIEAGKYFNITHQDIYNGLKISIKSNGRGEILPVYNNSFIINDSYNANPDSTKASIQGVLEHYKEKNIWLVLGDMLELGVFEYKFHEDIGKWLNKTNIQRLITVGDLSKIISNAIVNNKIITSHFSTVDEAINLIRKEKPNNTIILLKGSRKVGLEMIFEQIPEKFTGGVKN